MHPQIHRSCVLRAVWALGGASALSPGDAAQGQVAFTDVATARGLVFTTPYGTTFTGWGFGPESMQRNFGNGAAVGDYDNDGDLDIYLLSNKDFPSRLFRNNLNQGSATFTDVTVAAGVWQTQLSRVAHFVDLDDDGRLDLLVVNDENNAGSGAIIYRNNGDGTFTDVTASSGLSPIGFLHCGVALADYDRDGLLDIYVTNWLYNLGTTWWLFPGHNQLFRNLGNFTFQDVTLGAGLGMLQRDSMTALFFDFTGDGYPDIYVAVDHWSDEFYVNNGNGTFTVRTLETNATHTGNDMGIACADFDDDDDLDLYVTNITDEDGFFGTTQFNTLLVNHPQPGGLPLFIDEAHVRGAANTYWGWGTVFFDPENNGVLDIAAVNGFTEYINSVIQPYPLAYTPPVLFMNDGSGVFTREYCPGFDNVDDARALIAFDYDRDGDEDLLITNVNQPTRLLENVTPGAGHWLDVAVVQGPLGNRDGIGVSARVVLNGVVKRRDLICGYSYLSGTPAEMHFGLGTTSVVEQLEISWTDGTVSTYTNVPADRRIQVWQIPGDLNRDGTVSAAELQQVPGCLSGPAQPLSHACHAFDTNLDGRVDLADYAALHRAASDGF